METSKPITLLDLSNHLKDLGFKGRCLSCFDLVKIAFKNSKTGESIIAYAHSDESEDYSHCVVEEIFIDSEELAYPEGYWEGDEWHGGITLASDTGYVNLNLVNLETLDKFLWYVRHPIQAQKEFMKGFLKELDIFFEKFATVLERLKLEEYESSILPIGYIPTCSEPFVVFVKGCERVYIFYSIFLNRLCINYEDSLVQVNDLSEDELESIILTIV